MTIKSLAPLGSYCFIERSVHTDITEGSRERKTVHISFNSERGAMNIQISERDAINMANDILRLIDPDQDEPRYINGWLDKPCNPDQGNPFDPR